MLTIPMTRRNGRLEPIDALSAADLRDAMPEGATAMVRITRARSLPEHRRWWALCNALSEAGWFPGLDREAVSAVLKLQVGHVTAVALSDGARVLIPRSLSFAAADRATAHRVMQAAEAWVAEQTGLTGDQILDHAGGVGGGGRQMPAS